MKSIFELVLGNKNSAKPPTVLKVNVVALFFVALTLFTVLTTAAVGAYYTFSIIAVNTVYREEAKRQKHLVQVLDSLSLIVARETEFVAKFSDLETNLSLANGLSTISEDIKMQSVGGWLLFSDRIIQGIGSSLEMQISGMEETIASNKRQKDFLEQRLVTIMEMSERQKMYFAEKPSILPVRGRVTSEFGTRNHPVFNRAIRHEGIDIANAMWTPVKATADGICTHSGLRGSYGIMVEVTHRNSGYVTRYAHMVNAKVKIGDVIRRGDIIGNLGNTGISTGPHLHYEVRKGDRAIDPRNYMIDSRMLSAVN